VRSQYQPWPAHVCDEDVDRDKVVMFYNSANRDEDVFAAADDSDIGRDLNPHLSFGGGGPISASGQAERRTRGRRHSRRRDPAVELPVEIFRSCRWAHALAKNGSQHA
jgi:hypothetical protein